MTARTVPFFSVRKRFAALRPAFERRVDAIMQHGKYSHGATVAQLELAIQTYTGARNAVAMNSATDALLLGMRALGIGPGDEVIVPTFTFVASASTVALLGAKPVFVDIESSGYGLSVEDVVRKLTPATKLIMPVHMFYQMAEMGEVTEVARAHGVPVFEDSAEAIGMFWNGVHAGRLGVAGVLSFFPTKTLGALGDAGMLLTDDDELAYQCALLRHHGRTGETLGRMAGISNRADICGTNSKMDDIQAAFLLTRLEGLAHEIARRHALAAAYDRGLSSCAQHLRRPVIRQRSAQTNPVYYSYVVETEHKRELAAHLAAHGIGTEDYYPKPLHLQQCFAHLGYRPGDCPNAERACLGTLALPLYPDLEIEDVDYVCERIREFHQRGSRARAAVLSP